MRNNGSGTVSWVRGLAALLAASMLAPCAALAGPAEKVLHTFAGPPSDGNQPTAGVFADSAGNLYGTTEFGGPTSCDPPIGCGVVYKLTPGGTYEVLHYFVGSDGYGPNGVVVDGGGNLYGTTTSGGTSGNGVVFEISAGGTYTLLHSFAGGANDGAAPFIGLTADGAGNVYGTTPQGGASGNGVIFKISPGGTYSVLYSFAGGTGGGSPGALIVDGSGNLFGIADSGGDLACALSGGKGCGLVYKLTPGGTYTVLYAFTGGTNGYDPATGLAVDSSGNLYGTMLHGGIMACDCGVVFKLSPGGTYTVLYSFTGGSDGGQPIAGVIVDSEGNLYGTNTIDGGPALQGVVFKLSPDGTYTVLYSFALNAGGYDSDRSLIADAAGNLYGTTNQGGASGNGVVFELTGTGFGGSIGDTHLTTFSGMHYDFQASGDFLLAEAGASFEVQTRQASGAPTWPNAAVNKAVATRMGKTRVAICVAPTRLVIDGSPRRLNDGISLSLPGGVTVSRSGDAYLIQHDNGDSVRAQLNHNAQPRNDWIDVSVGLGGWQAQPLRGLLANPHGDVNEIALRDGVGLHEPVSFDVLYGRYGNGWRVPPEQSLLCRHRKVKPGIPTKPFYANDLDRRKYERARGICAKAGVRQPSALEDCTLDVAVLGTAKAASVFVDAPAPVAVWQAGAK